MSHLHIPDGILPVWLWLSGLIIAIIAVSISLFAVRNTDLRKKIPLLGMMSAMMLVGMNIEILPGYHVNLSVITGIIIGPWLAVIASFIVNIILSFLGHGGITVIGLNTIDIGFEGVAGFLAFTALRRFMKPGGAAGLATVITLLMSTCLMLAIVTIANVDISSEGAHGLRELYESPTTQAAARMFKVNDVFNLKFFAIAAFAMGAVGWLIEAFVTATAISFIAKVRPDMVEKA